MRYNVTHTTRYEYQNAVSVSHHLLRLTPRPIARQTLLDYQLVFDPKPALTVEHRDYFGNRATFVTIEGPHRRFSVTARSVVEIRPTEAPKSDETPAWEDVRDSTRAISHPNGEIYELHSGNREENEVKETEPAEFVFPSPQVPFRQDYANYAAASFAADRPVLLAALDLMRRIHADFKFDPQATTVATPLAQVFHQRRGVCQDFAHFQIACLRSLGLPARYVSGYLETIPPPGKPRLVGADASHAWIQVWSGESWVDLDPTNAVQPSERHITVAWGRDYGDVSPSRGVLVGSGEHQLKVAVDVVPA